MVNPLEIMMVPNRFKQWITRFIPIRLNAGYGISTDDQVSLKELPSQEQQDMALAQTKCLYTLNPNVGLFEMIGPVKKRNQDQPFYKFKHVATGQIFTVTKPMLNFLFEKQKETKQ